MLLHKVLKKKKQVIPACWSESWQSSSFSEKFIDTYKIADFTVNTEKKSTTLKIYTKIRYVHSMHSSNIRTGTLPQSRNPFHIKCNECSNTDALKWSSYTKSFPQQPCAKTADTLQQVSVHAAKTIQETVLHWKHSEPIQSETEEHLPRNYQTEGHSEFPLNIQQVLLPHSLHTTRNPEII